MRTYLESKREENVKRKLGFAEIPKRKYVSVSHNHQSCSASDSDAWAAESTMAKLRKFYMQLHLIPHAWLLGLVA